MLSRVFYNTLLTDRGGVIPSVRAFVAIELPSILLKRIEELQETLKKEVKGTRSVSWPRPEGIHLTLKFLGDVEETRIEDISTALTGASSGFKSMRLKAGGVGCFPTQRNPRVIWVGLSHSEELERLQNNIEEAAAGLGFEKEDRPFKPHLTLCRIKSPEDGRILGHSIEKFKDFIDIDFVARDLVLFKSQLSPRGAVYTALKRISLE